MVVALRLAPITTVDGHRRGRRSNAMGSSSDAAIGRSLTSLYSEWIPEALDELPGSFLITDPAISGHPIVFASRGFVALSGYPRDEVLGRNGRIFQGPATDRRSVMEIREAIREERAMEVSLLNYRKDGTPHWILFHLCPVFGADDGRVVHFVAVQVPIPRRPGGSKCRGATAMLLGTCRNELRGDDVLGSDLTFLSFDDADNRGLEAEQAREASDWERQKAASTAKDILSALTLYSKFTGRPVCEKRCSLASAGVAPLSSSLTLSLSRIKQSFVLTDPHLPSMPIVYASDAFLSLTGYSRHEVLGRNCRFLNGPDTDVEGLHQIRDNIRAEKACTVRLLNYRKDGSSFWNLLHISPVRNASGKIAYYVGVHQIEEGSKHGGHGLSPEMRQLGAVGAVKVAVRSLSARIGPSSSS